MDPKKLQDRKPLAGTKANLNTIKIALPSLPEKLKVEKTLSQVVKESDTKAASQGKRKPSDDGLPIFVVVEGSADVESSDGEYAEGVEILVAAAAADFNELSHQIRSTKQIAVSSVKYLPTVSGVFYGALLTLSCADSETFDSQEITLYTEPLSEATEEETYTFKVQPKTRIVKILILSSRRINSNRVMFPSKLSSKTIEGSTVKYCGIVNGENCTTTIHPLTPTGLKNVL